MPIAFPGNVIPATRFDPTAVKIQALIPPTQNNAYTNNANYTNISSRISGIPSLKLDHSIGSKSKLSFYWSTTGTESLYSLPNGNADGLPPTITQARGTFIYSQTERLNFDHSLDADHSACTWAEATRISASSTADRFGTSTARTFP